MHDRIANQKQKILVRPEWGIVLYELKQTGHTILESHAHKPDVLDLGTSPFEIKNKGISMMK